MDKTKEVLAAMLVENTGRAMCDSGDFYGRHWQKNQGKDFEAVQPTRVEFGVWGHDGKQELEVMVTHDVYHWLSEKLDRSDDAEALEVMFDEYVTTQNEDEHWLGLMEGFTGEYLEEKLGQKPTGIYGDGDAMTINTYNGEDLLSQTIQYHYFELRDGNFEGEFVLLQIHGGCDARGGYTKPKIFQVNEELGIMDNARGSVYCEKTQDHHWTTDDGSNWAPESISIGPDKWDRVNLEDREVIVLGEGQTAGDVFEKGKVVVDKDNKEAFCPFCCGKLNASSY